MLAVSPLRDTTKDEKQEQMESFKNIGKEEMPDLSDASLLESIDFDDLFMGINDGDVLPDLEMDPEIFAEFSGTVSGSESEKYSSPASVEKGEDDSLRKVGEEDKDSGSGSGLDSSLSTREGEEIVSKRDDDPRSVANPVAATKDGGSATDKGRKSSSAQPKNNNGNNNQGKRKVKVDWTPELHRRFVQAVEQLGVDKAVPSRILEIMGIDCLTRHNIASHLQKYRSHRKHLLAREAEAANWSQRRHMYGGTTVGSGGGKRTVSPWHAPTMGFPPMTPPPPMHHHFRPLHVWGHPSMDQSLLHIWPKQLTHSPPPPPPQTWPPPPLDASYWQHHHHRAPNGLTPGTPCFPQPLAVAAPPPAARFATPPVPGIPPPALYKSDPGSLNGVSNGQSSAPFEFHPTKESIDAAVGDVLSKPWLPLPLGLKPPALDSVMVELQRQGVPKIPPSTTCP